MPFAAIPQSSPFIDMCYGYVTIPSHGWFMALFYPHDIIFQYNYPYTQYIICHYIYIHTTYYSCGRDNEP